jgi:CheY-like chemotaxis protein
MAHGERNLNQAGAFLSSGTETAPASPSLLDREQEAAIGPSPDTVMRVLIVEDEPLIADFMSDVLRRPDVRVIGAAMTGPEAMQIAEREHPDIALVDISLVGAMDGWAVARVLRDAYGTRPVFITGDYGQEVDARALAAGAAGCLHKPFRAAELVEMVTQARRANLESRRAAR